jgi:OFA family oxalate/formate antiporter-like MFS transporter
MSNKVCPFFAKDDDYCDVGCGYISPHDVRMMVAFCNCRYGECTKYQELAIRFPHMVDPLEAGPGHGPCCPPGGTGTKEEPIKKPDKPVVRPFRVKWSLPFQLRCVSGVNSRVYTLPTELTPMTVDFVRNGGWRVALAGAGVNLALGILYAWSIFRGAIGDSIQAGGPFHWDPAKVNDPYALACLVFAAAMVLGGMFQDRFGPKVTCVMGGLLLGAGLLWVSQTTSYWGWVAGFGVLGGTGIGFGYSAATPAALKWFPSTRAGLAAGVVVSGFGLAPALIAPLAFHMFGVYGSGPSMMFFGIACALVVSGLGLLISNPPANSLPFGAGESKTGKVPAQTLPEVSPSRLFADARFYSLWTCYFIGAGAGLMVIGSAQGLAGRGMGETVYLVLVLISLGNAAGRLVAGAVSDRVGRANTLTFILVLQAGLMFLAVPEVGGKGNPVFVALLVTIMVFNYGTNLSLFPAFARDYWGMKNFGTNYGILFSAWGAGAFVLVRVGEMLKAQTGGFAASLAVAGVLLLVGAMLSLSLRTRKADAPAPVPARFPVEEEDLVMERARR